MVNESILGIGMDSELREQAGECAKGKQRLIYK